MRQKVLLGSKEFEKFTSIEITLTCKFFVFLRLSKDVTHALEASLCRKIFRRLFYLEEKTADVFCLLFCKKFFTLRGNELGV